MFIDEDRTRFGKSFNSNLVGLIGLGMRKYIRKQFTFIYKSGLLPTVSKR